MHFFSLNEAIYVKVLCKPTDVTEMEGGMIITSEGLNDNYLGRSEGTQTSESTRPHSPGILAFYDHKMDYFITPGDYFLLQSGNKHVCLYIAQFLTLR